MTQYRECKGMRRVCSYDDDLRCPECKGLGQVPRFPWTGFTVELDGDPDALERVHHAMSMEMQKILRERELEESYSLPITNFSARYTPSWPFRGKLAYRNDRFDLQDLSL